MICRLFKKAAPTTELPLNTVELGHGLVTAAISQIGNGERGSNNSGEHVERYAAAVDHRAPMLWCSAFYYWCYLEACDFHGVEPLIPHLVRRAVRNRWAGRAKDMAWLIKHFGGREVSFEESKPGDYVLWHRGAQNARTGHGGILLSPNVTRQTFVTIEGNKGNYPANVQTYAHNNGEAQLLGFYRLPAHQPRRR